MKLKIEASVLEQTKPSGVNYLTDGLTSEFAKRQSEEFKLGFFWLNFLGSKSAINKNVISANNQKELRQIKFIPQRIYAKLVYYNIAPPLIIGKCDWVLFPNFYIWPLFGQVKKMVIIHDLCYLRHPQYVEDKNRKFLNRVATKSAKKAELIVVDSEFIADEITDLIGVPKSKIHVLGVPVDSHDFDKNLDKGTNHLLNRYGIQKPYILSFGTLEPRKNLSCLVEAYCLLPDEIRAKFSLVLAGKWGWKIDDLKNLIEQKQAEGYDIITPGYIDHGDRATFYRNASYYAITTHYEGFGMPLLEALHCGIPTVAVDIPVLREVGGDACLWSNKNPQDVSDKLAVLIKDKDLADSLARKGPEQSSNFTWQKSVDGLIARLTGISTS